MQGDPFEPLRTEKFASATHPANLTPAHLPLYKDFQDRANKAFQGSFPRRQTPRYSEVHALLLHWADDDLGVIKEILTLKGVLEDHFRFDTNIWPIPSVDPLETLTTVVNEFKKQYAAKDHLMLIYYGGHSMRSSVPSECIWTWFVAFTSPSGDRSLLYRLHDMLTSLRLATITLITLIAQALTGT